MSHIFIKIHLPFITMKHSCQNQFSVFISQFSYLKKRILLLLKYWQLHFQKCEKCSKHFEKYLVVTLHFLWPFVTQHSLVASLENKNCNSSLSRECYQRLKVIHIEQKWKESSHFCAERQKLPFNLDDRKLFGGLGLKRKWWWR